MPKGNYAAYMNFKPTPQQDVGQGISNFIDTNIKLRQARLQEKRVNAEIGEINERRDKVFSDAFSGDMTAVSEMIKRTGNKNIDQTTYEFANYVRDSMVALTKKYGKKGLYTNPEAMAEMQKLKQSAKYMFEGGQHAAALINDLSNKLQPSIDPKTGAYVAPAFSKYNRKYVDLVQGIVDGKYETQLVNGRLVAAVTTEDDNGEKSLKFVDVEEMAKGYFGDLIPTFDTDKYLADAVKKDGWMGSQATTVDRNGRIYYDKTFNQIQPEVRQKLYNDFGEIKGRTKNKDGTFSGGEVELTQRGISMLADFFNMSPSAVDDISVEDYEKAIGAIEQTLRVGFEEETKDRVNVPLMNANTYAAMARANIAKANAQTKKINAQTEAIDNANYSVSVNGGLVSFASKNGSVSLEVPRMMNGKPMENIPKQVKKFSNFVYDTQTGKFYATMGTDRFELSPNMTANVLANLKIKNPTQLKQEAQTALDFYGEDFGGIGDNPVPLSGENNDDNGGIGWGLDN